MAKPTTENIALPDFPVTLVRLLDGNFIEEDTSLQQLVANRQKGLILYFYPKDMTPGCTTQACDFRDNQSGFDDAGYTVFGVSPDPVERHAKFREKHDLNFPLLADTDNSVADAYGVWREKKNFGKTYMGIVRSTFFIDEEGKLTDIQDNVRAKGHVERLIEAI